MQWVQNLNFALNLVHKAQFPSYEQPRAAGGLRNPVVELVGAWAEWWSSIQPPESFDGGRDRPGTSSHHACLPICKKPHKTQTLKIKFDKKLIL